VIAGMRRGGKEGEDEKGDEEEGDTQQYRIAPRPRAKDRGPERVG